MELPCFLDVIVDMRGGRIKVESAASCGTESPLALEVWRFVAEFLEDSFLPGSPCG